MIVRLCRGVLLNREKKEKEKESEKRERERIYITSNYPGDLNLVTRF
jgi:hypothetical protein